MPEALSSERLILAILFATTISVVSHTARFLTFGGSVAQLILGSLLFGIGGWQWTLPILTFFVLSSLLSILRRGHKTSVNSIFEKSSRRDAWQVLANGGVPAAVLLLWFFTEHESLYIAYLGSIAAGTADTWGTEIGTLSRSSPV